MDEQTALLTAIAQMSAGFIADTAFRHLMFIVVALVVLAGLFTYILKRGEKDFGLDTSKAVDALEAAAALYVDTKGAQGTVWPLTLLLLAMVLGGFWLTGLVIRP
jgi:hypothetical protein